MATLREQITSWSFGGVQAPTKNVPHETDSSRNLAPTVSVTEPTIFSAEEMAATKAAVIPLSAPQGLSAGYYALKTQLHQKMISRIDLTAVESMPDDQLRAELRDLVLLLIDEEALPVNEQERSHLITDLQNEILGLGPLEPLLADPTISEIMVNGYKTIYVERAGRLELTTIRFNDDAHLLKVIDKIVTRVGRRIDEASPMVDARLPDGSRVNAVIPPIALDGPALSIRRFAVTPLRMQDLIAKNSLTAGMAELLAGLVRAKTNILISGGTGTGKTTLLNILSSYIPANERIITIEDTAELQLQQPHVVRMETRVANIEGRGEIPMRGLVKNSLRMRPDRIVLGEVRGGEVIDMLQAMNTGHDGSLTTVHANSPRDALGRLENLVGMGGLAMPAKALRQQIASAIQVIVQVTRMSDGTRKITSIHEISGMEGDVITTQEIFTYERMGINPDNTVHGRFRATGVRPMLADRLRTCGIIFAEDIFDPFNNLE